MATKFGDSYGTSPSEKLYGLVSLATTKSAQTVIDTNGQHS